MLLIYFLTIILVIITKETDCVQNFVTRDDEIYILSDETSTYEEAEARCQSYESQLAQIDSQEEKDFLRPHLQRKYLDNTLATVNILQRSSVHQSPNGPIFYTARKLRSSNGFEDPEDVTDFTAPTGNFDLRSFMLYSRPTGEFDEVVHFCWHPGRDIVRRVCNLGWFDNFQLYGASSDSNNTIKINNYLQNGLTSAPMLRSVRSDSYSLGFPAFIFVPDIWVNIGAESGVSQTDWFWNNGTRISDSTFPAADASVCQQMSWPLTYDDGVNLRPKKCGKSRYICHTKVEINVEEVRCDGNALRLKIPKVIAENATVQVIAFPNRLINIPTNTTNYIVEDLLQQTNYTLQVNIAFRDCVECILFLSAEGRTGYGVPEPVNSAHVLNSVTSNCVLAWKHSRPEQEDVQYQIFSKSEGLSFITTVSPHLHPNAHFLGDVVVQEIDLIHHGFNNTVTFQIQVISSCGTPSALVDVLGSCSSPSRSTTTPKTQITTSSTTKATTATTQSTPPTGSQQTHLSVAVWTLIALITAILLVLLVVFFYKRIRAKKTKRTVTLETTETHTERTTSPTCNMNGRRDPTLEGFNLYDRL